MSQVFEVTKDGVKLPYGRFLSDSAGGYLVILMVLYALFIDLQIPHFIGLGSWRTIFPITNLAAIKDQVGAAGILTAGVIILLMGSPIGLMLNGISYFSLGFVQFIFLNYWATHPNQKLLRFLTYSTAQEFNRHILVHAFSFIHSSDKEHQKITFYDRIRYLEHYIEIYFPQHTRLFEHLEGLKIFIRNIAFLCSFCMIYSLLLGIWNIAIILGIIAISFLFYSCLVNLYHFTQVLFTVYIICLHAEDFSLISPNSFGQTIKCLRTLAQKQGGRIGSQ